MYQLFILNYACTQGLPISLTVLNKKSFLSLINRFICLWFFVVEFCRCIISYIQIKIYFWFGSVLVILFVLRTLVLIACSLDLHYCMWWWLVHLLYAIFRVFHFLLSLGEIKIHFLFIHFWILCKNIIYECQLKVNF